MNKKIIAALLAVFLLLSFGFSAFALSSSIGDWISLLGRVDQTKFTIYSETEWNSIPIEEKRSALDNAISSYGGISHLDDEFISSDKSFDCYNDLIGNNSGFLPSVSSSYASITLETLGQADFGHSFYKNNGHSSGSFGDSGGAVGKFGDGTVADTLNDDFLNYFQDNPYESNNIFHRLSSGDYTFEYGADLRDYFNPYNQKDCYLVIGFCNVYYKGVLYDSLEFGGDTIVKSNSGSFEDANAKYNFFKDNIYYDYDTMQIVIPKNLQFNSSADYCYIGNYITSEPIEESDDIEAVAIDDDGNQIDININSDGVTYEGNTYNYNNDNTVTIGDKTYYIAVQPNNVDDDYYKQFLNDIINNYYNYYTTNSTPFDGTDILTSLKSIFSSLETFRSYCYSQFKQIYDTVYSGFYSVRSTITSTGNRIIQAINSLGGSSDLTDEQLADYQNKLQEAVESRFGAVLVLREIVDNALDSYKYSSTSSIDIKFKSFSCSIDFSKWFNDSNLNSIRFLMAAFIYVTFALNTFRRIPSYIYNGGDR